MVVKPADESRRSRDATAQVQHMHRILSCQSTMRKPMLPYKVPSQRIVGKIGWIIICDGPQEGWAKGGCTNVQRFQQAHCNTLLKSQLMAHMVRTLNRSLSVVFKLLHRRPRCHCMWHFMVLL